MKKLFTNPVVDVMSLSAENEVMTVLLSADQPAAGAVVIDDTASKPAADDTFGYWSAK